MTIKELEQCIELYGKDIYTFCLHLSGSRQEAEDLYQETFLTAMQKRRKINMSNNPKSYFLSVALRLWKNKRRKILLAVKKLEEKYRIPIILYYTEQLSVKEIALFLSLPVGTVKSRLHYARERLKKDLEEYFHE